MQTDDSIEQMGIEKSREKIQEADIVIALFDASTHSIAEIQGWQSELGVTMDKLILVGNKIDLALNQAMKEDASFKDVLFISAKNKLNIAALENALNQKVVGDALNKEGTIVTNARHVASLKKLMLALNDIETGLIQNVTGDLLALDIRQALHYLGTITGEITSEDQLDFIFSKFCIGK
jgi:tRNA modification GTPase